MWEARRTYADVISYIENFVDGDGSLWDDFISVPIKNPALEHVRIRATLLPAIYPVPAGQRGYCDKDGIEELRRTLAQLKKDAARRGLE